MLGDARLSLTKAPDHHYDLIILDAFSSDSIPVHLLTRQAMKLYLTKLANDGILAFHISNRYLNLKTVLGDLARDEGLAYFFQEYRKLSDAEKREKKSPSAWMIMAYRSSDLGKIPEDKQWKPLSGGSEGKLWTDDFSNIFSVLNLRLF